MKPIHLRNVPPPAETFNHVEFLNNLIYWIKPEKYLELIPLLYQFNYKTN